MSQAPPNNLVRLCRRRNEFLKIVNEAINLPNQNWNQDLINRVIQYILEEKETSISVYRADTLDPFDYGHALAVIAEGISQKEFRSNSRKRSVNCTRGSLIIPTTFLPESTKYNFTPENNLDFYPANNYHFDLTINDTVELATALLNGICQKSIKWTLLGNDGKLKGSYQFQAIIAYSHCLRVFGKLDQNTPPLNWTNGNTIPASEQIDTLKHLAQVTIVDNPTSTD